jgi:ubiquinone biosynthesis monooxygenase Coq6
MNHPPRSEFQTPNTTAYQRFLPTGPIAFLPLSPTVSSLVWSTRPSIATALKSVDPSVLASMINAAFRLPEVSLRYLHNLILEREKSGASINLAQIQQEISWREKSHGIHERSAYSSSESESGVPSAEAEHIPPAVTSIQAGTIASFPLKHSHAESYIGEGEGARTVLLGDAAHTIHPLAGQGLNISLADVGSLTQCIEDTLAQGGDIGESHSPRISHQSDTLPGSRTALLAYTRDRYFENHKMLSAVDKLHKLYSSTSEPVVWARSVGLEVLNELDTVKAAMMLTAGSGARVSSQPGFALAARGVEIMHDTVVGAKFVGQSLAGFVGVGIQEVGKAISKAQR